MAEIQIEVRGKDAVAATQELFSTSGLSGNWQPVGGVNKEGTLATIGVIVGIIGGTLTAAEQLRKWYQESKQGESPRIEYVLLVKGEKRLMLKDVTLDNATLKQIEQILDD
ncbi:MAG: hypothetical protein AB1589_03735 [Cyanobacteriota bacterium]